MGEISQIEMISQCRSRALNLLARREHSQRELSFKLQNKGFTPAIVAEVIQQLCAKNFLSDKRFAELYVLQRARKGYGPMRIQQELQQRGVETELIEQVLAEQQQHWLENAHQAWQKYKRLHPTAESAKQRNFLFTRGFNVEQIQKIITF